MYKEGLKLKSLEFREWQGEHLDWEVNKATFGSFRVFLGDNAQGKTRLFNILTFIHELHTVPRTFKNPNYRALCEMHFSEEDDDVGYQISMVGSNPGPGLLFEEVIIRNGKTLFDRKNQLLIEDKTGKKLEKFFLPGSSLATTSILEKEYETIVSLQDFFERMLFLQGNRFSGGNIEIGTTPIKLNRTGSNIGAVLNNWKENFSVAYKEVIEAFKSCFPYISEVGTKEVNIPEVSINVPSLTLTEFNTDIDISQATWSDGFLRALCLFALPCTPFQRSDDILRPSFIGIDEIENGLDFNTLSKVINYYESYSDLIQIAISTHSPLVCNLTTPENWSIVRRKGVSVYTFSPNEVEDLDSERIRLRDDNWEFYRRHIAKSPLYKVQ